MVGKKAFLIGWLGGLAVFAVSLTFHAPLAIDAVPGGILDHQAAPDAASVDAIQQAWETAGLTSQARLAMITDLIFIGIYGVGAALGGLYFRARDGWLLKALGLITLAAALVFLVTDYVETILQFIQLMRFEGSDTLAGIASKMGPAKVVTFLVALFGPILALILERFSYGKP